MGGYYETLAERARSGDRHAWETLWSHLRPQIYSKLRPMLSGIPGMEPEDVLGWTMGEAWRLVNLHEPSRSKVATFVITGLRARLQNLRRDALAKGRGAFYLAARPTDDHDPTDVPDEHSLCDHHRAEAWADIDAALGRINLRDTHSSVIEAVRRHPDASLTDIAKIAKISDKEAQRFFHGVRSAVSGPERSALRSRSAPTATLR